MERAVKGEVRSSVAKAMEDRCVKRDPPSSDYGATGAWWPGNRDRVPAARRQCEARAVSLRKASRFPRSAGSLPATRWPSPPIMTVLGRKPCVSSSAPSCGSASRRSGRDRRGALESVAAPGRDVREAGGLSTRLMVNRRERKQRNGGETAHPRSSALMAGPGQSSAKISGFCPSWPHPRNLRTPWLKGFSESPAQFKQS